MSMRLIFCMTLVATRLWCQHQLPLTITLSGTVRDAQTGEALAGAEVSTENLASGVISNRYGYFSIVLRNQAPTLIKIQYQGYVTLQRNIALKKDSLMDVLLEPSIEGLKDVEVNGERLDAPQNLNTNFYSLSVAQVKRVTNLAGEPDPVKVLQLLPGVQTSHEGTSNLSVRGGSYDQNLFLLDEATVYNPVHALSFYSVFNTDALQGVNFYKSAIPVRYGGRLSSVVDVQMKEGNRFRRTGSASIGAIASRLTLEGPIGKSNKISYMVSGRYSYAGQVMNGIYFLGKTFFNNNTANNSTTNNKINFYDLNAKINWRKNDRNHFYLSTYSGHDQFFFLGLTNGYSLSWGNQTATARWNHVHNARLFSNATAVYSNYSYEYKLVNDSRLFKWGAGLKEINLKQDFDFYRNEKNHVTFGWSMENRWLSPGKVSPQFASSVIAARSIPEQKSIVASAYVGNEHHVSSAIKLGYGLRYYWLGNLGPYTHYYFQPNDDFPYDSAYRKSGVAESYHRMDPRAWISIKLSAQHSVNVSVDHTTQFLHLLGNSVVGLPTDMWMVSGGNIKPQMADIVATGYFFQSQSKEWNASLSSFYKLMQHVTDFKDNANLFANRYVQSQMLQGKGLSRGIEFYLKKEGGRFTGALSYTFSRTDYKINGLNSNRWFPARSDRRHSLKFNASQRLTRRIEFGQNFIFGTGTPVTLPKGYFSFGRPYIPGQPSFDKYNYYTERNGYRLPIYHRLDVSVKISGKKNESRRVKAWWSLDVYNVYGRRNPFGIYAPATTPTIEMSYLFRIVPTMSYNLTF